jgi:hypothetical protein
MPCALDPRGCRERGCSWGCLRRAGRAVEDPSRLQAELGAPLVARHGAAGTVEVGGARAPGVEVGVGRQYAPYWRGQCGGVLEDSGGDSRAGHVRVCERRARAVGAVVVCCKGFYLWLHRITLKSLRFEFVLGVKMLKRGSEKENCSYDASFQRKPYLRPSYGRISLTFFFTFQFLFKISAHAPSTGGGAV